MKAIDVARIKKENPDSIPDEMYEEALKADGEDPTVVEQLTVGGEMKRL